MPWRLLPAESSTPAALRRKPTRATMSGTWRHRRRWQGSVGTAPAPTPSRASSTTAMEADDVEIVVVPAEPAPPQAARGVAARGSAIAAAAPRAVYEMATRATRATKASIEAVSKLKCRAHRIIHSSTLLHAHAYPGR